MSDWCRLSKKRKKGSEGGREANMMRYRTFNILVTFGPTSKYWQVINTTRRTTKDTTQHHKQESIVFYFYTLNIVCFIPSIQF